MTELPDRQNTDQSPANTSWVGEVSAHTYSKDASSTIVEFASNNWKEIAGVGLLCVAGTVLIASRSSGLSTLTKLFKGGEASAVGADLTPELASRFKDLRHMVFDMDRTLVDHDKSLAVLKRTMSEGLIQHTGLDGKIVKEAMAATTKRLNSPYFYNRMDEIKPLLQGHVGPGVNLDTDLASVGKHSQAAYYDALKVSPEIQEMLTAARSKGLGVHVFTAGSTTRALEKLHGAGILGQVDTVFSSGAHAFEDTARSGLLLQDSLKGKVVQLAGDAKNTGSGYDAVIEHLQTSGRRIAMTGDHPVEDIAQSRLRDMLAMKAIWYKNKPPVEGTLPPLELQLPHLELQTPAQLTNFIRQYKPTA